MTEKEHINQYIKSTCDLIIQHVKNIITLQENINKPWGYSSRLMEHLFHPENELLFKKDTQRIFLIINQQWLLSHGKNILFPWLMSLTTYGY